MSGRDERLRGVVASAAPTSAEGAVRALDALPDGAAWFELRADAIGKDDVARCVARSSRPTIVTVRRPEDGGAFRGSEAERKEILESALAAGATCVDVEENGALASWAAGLPPDRVILSHHGAPCRAPELRALVSRMDGHPAARLKIVPRVDRPADGAALHDLLRVFGGPHGRLAAFGTGPAGLPTRILALSWGSWATYGAAEPARPTAEAQPAAADLLAVYRVQRIGSSTRRFALAGRPVLASPSPRLHAAAYVETGLDAVYVPLETERLADALALCDPAGPFALAGLGVTIPFKEEATAVAKRRDPFVEACGAANTLRMEPGGTHAFNTDGPAVLELVRRVLDPRGKIVAILGAGGTARAAALALRQAGARVVLFNRTTDRAVAAASALDVAWQPRGELTQCAWDVLVQATPLGREGEDAFPEGRLRGRLIVDAVYGPRTTPLVKRARIAGVDAFDGLDLLASQAAEQFRILTGVRADADVFASVSRDLRGPR